MIDEERGAAVRVATWSARRPWWAIVCWVAFVVLCVGAGAATGTNRGTLADFRVGEAGRAEAIAADAGLTPPPVEQVLITAPTGPLDPVAAEAATREVTARMRALPQVAGVGEPVSAADGSAVRVPVTLAGDPDTARRAVRALLPETAAVQAAHPGLVVVQTGGSSISAGVDDKLGADLGRVELISLPLTFAILFLAFGSAVAAGLPVLLALSAFAGAVGLYGVASWVFPDAGGAAISVVFLLGMAVGVDYALFLVKRVREERARGLAHRAAVEAAAETSGRVVLTSGVAVILSLAGLHLVGDVIFSSIATGAMLVVAVAVAGSLTVLPALLVVLGRFTGGRRHARNGASGRWQRVLQPALRRPVATLVAGLAVTAALALPAAAMRLATEGKETFPVSVPAVAAYDRLTAAFPDAGAAHLVAVRAAPERAADVAVALDGLAARTPGNELRTSADGTTSVFRVPVPHPENSPEAHASLQQLRAQVLPAALPGPGVEHAVSGEIARGVDYAAHQDARIPAVIVFVTLATLLVMLVAFRSLPLAALGVAFNLASVAVAWGVLVLVFQGTWAEDLLGFESMGFVGSRMPLMVFAILVGLSTDYQIFLVSRIREAVRSGVPTRQAVLDGIAGSAAVVTSAAVIMLSVFASFLFIDRIEMKQVAVGLSVAVLFDAVVLRILILPSVLTLLGERSWWPCCSTPWCCGSSSCRRC
ncbi:MMPL family transporter [Pseudonocardia cypriaca]|uniref:RND superfamily putative drug exporter n=1 Tax=Pseudonocardia cypriaca TaxID=882449 RepID=A0A543GEK2_9PSEU|nr:MMPL family transporter [Pseudonocardia cypriaca]TQM44512.1 RND superfamily putative drug exporter [Pseudonocardia cypriaca]